jgi:DNA repair exonuclease SbcCD ATPase subunit
LRNSKETPRLSQTVTMENVNTNLNKLKAEAELNALKRLQALINTPDQLEQIEQHMERNQKKKEKIETQLKTAIQSHFISVSSCMEQLKEVDKGLDEVRANLESIEKEHKSIMKLDSKLSELKREALKHRQLKSAKENVRNILNVQDWLKQASKHLEDDQLLMAHRFMMDLERCRNDILEELQSSNENSIDDTKVRSLIIISSSSFLIKNYSHSL